MFDYTTATRDQKEEFLQDKILICLQATKQPMTNAQIREYLLKHVDELPANVTKLTTSKKGSVYSDFQIRVNMSITSLYKLVSKLGLDSLIHFIKVPSPLE